MLLRTCLQLRETRSKMASSRQVSGKERTQSPSSSDHELGLDSIKPQPVRVNVSGTRYAVVSLVAEQLEMEIVEEESDDCELYWVDTSISVEQYMRLKQYQYINHFSGMGEICRKDSLARNIQKMKKILPEEYDIAPRSWVLPAEYSALCKYMSEHKTRRRRSTYIIKPPNASMGNGISLIRSADRIPHGESIVVQEYLDKPFLLDGFKFDLRVYVLVTSCSPLRIFVYRDGLVRLSTKHYSPPTDSNLGEHFMHLTNYSINKYSRFFDRDKSIDRGSKRTLKYFNGWLLQNGCNVSELWEKIHDVIIKTLIMAQPYLEHSYMACRPGCRIGGKCQCFEILGFDILLDENRKPWVLEVNRSPSFGIDSQLDLDIKTGVIYDALRLVGIQPAEREKKMIAERMASKRRLLHSPRTRQQYDFMGEYKDSILRTERKMEEVKERLKQIWQEREVSKHEETFMGDYTRIYPSADPQTQILYRRLQNEALQASYTGRSRCFSGRRSLVSGLESMGEHELVDLLSQYEADEKFGGNLSPSLTSKMTPLHSIRPRGFYERSSTEAAFDAMAAREQEEERTQRVMLALNSLNPSYPGKENEDVKRILNEVYADWTTHGPKVGKFWLTLLDVAKRKELLTPMKDCLKELLHCHWRTLHIESLRLYRIFMRLLCFLISNHGQGLWSSFPGTPGESWERLFKKKAEVISLVELQCCRHIVTKCQSTVIAAYYYHHLQQPIKEPKGVANPPSSRPVTRSRLSDPVTRGSLTRRRTASLPAGYRRNKTPLLVNVTQQSTPMFPRL